MYYKTCVPVDFDARDLECVRVVNYLYLIVQIVYIQMCVSHLSHIYNLVV